MGDRDRDRGRERDRRGEDEHRSSRSQSQGGRYDDDRHRGGSGGGRGSGREAGGSSSVGRYPQGGGGTAYSGSGRYPGESLQGVGSSYSGGAGAYRGTEYPGSGGGSGSGGGRHESRERRASSGYEGRGAGGGDGREGAGYQGSGHLGGAGEGRYDSRERGSSGGGAQGRAGGSEARAGAEYQVSGYEGGGGGGRYESRERVSGSGYEGRTGGAFQSPGYQGGGVSGAGYGGYEGRTGGAYQSPGYQGGGISGAGYGGYEGRTSGAYQGSGYQGGAGGGGGYESRGGPYQSTGYQGSAGGGGGYESRGGSYQSTGYQGVGGGGGGSGGGYESRERAGGSGWGGRQGYESGGGFSGQGSGQYAGGYGGGGGGGRGGGRGGGGGGGGFGGGGGGRGRGGGAARPSSTQAQQVEAAVVSAAQRQQLTCDGPNGGQKNSLIAPPTLGQSLNVLVNHFKLKASGGAPIAYRYEVTILPQRHSGSSGAAPSDTLRTRKRLEVERARAVVGELAKQLQLRPTEWAFDGGHMLLTTIPLRREKTALDVTLGRAGFQVTYEFTKQLELAGVLQSFLSGDAGPLNDESREVLQALDVVLRHCISLMPRVLMRGSSAFFLDRRLRSQTELALGDGAHMAVGFRAAFAISAQGLTLSVDTTATAYIREQPLVEYLEAVMGSNALRQGIDARGRKMLEKRLKGMQARVVPDAERKPEERDRVIVIKGLDDRSTREYIFDHNGRSISIEGYFHDKYQRRLRFPHLPAITIGGKAALPMEVLHLMPCLPKKKPSVKQTQTLVKGSAFAPMVRKEDISEIITQQSNLLSGSSGQPLAHQVLHQFGLKLDESARNGMMQVPARLLPMPLLSGSSFDGSMMTFAPSDDGFYGNMQSGFFRCGAVQSWAVLSLVPSYELRGALDGFVDGLVHCMKENGIHVPDNRQGGTQPPIVYVGEGEDVPPSLNSDLFDHVLVKGTAAFRKTPQLLLVILDGNGSSPEYGVIKRLGFDKGAMTQCVSSGKAKLKEFNPRGRQAYLQNLVLKINAKLGGVNFVLAPDPKDRAQRAQPAGGSGGSASTSTASGQVVQDLGQRNAMWRPEPLRGERLCIIAVDVNHDSESQPSVAAVVASVDDACTQYIAELQMQPDARQELVPGMAVAVRKLLERYAVLNGGSYPSVILVLRDGVGDSQIAAMQEVEVKGIKQVCEDLRINPRLLVLTMQKRHNHRLYATPKRGFNDPGPGKNGNVRPGTVVENLGSFRVLDFLLVSHSGSIGTFRGVRFIKVVDELGLTPDEVQRLAYWLSYLNCRCQRPASMCAPVFYAHLAAKRGRALLDSQAGDGSSDSSRRAARGPGGQRWQQQQQPAASGHGSALTEAALSQLVSAALPGPPPLPPPVAQASSSAGSERSSHFRMVSIKEDLARRMWMV